MKDGNFPFAITILGRSDAILSGVKTVLLTTPNEIKVKVKNGGIRVLGESLKVLQMGGGDMYLKGDINSVEII